MRLDDLTYDLDADNVASEPIEVRLGRRDLGRMLVVRRSGGTLVHASVWQLPDILSSGDVLVFNNSKSVPGTLKLRTLRGAQVELRVAHIDTETTCIARPYPTHQIRAGRYLISSQKTRLKIEQTNIEPHGLCRISSSRPIKELLRQEGLPITSFFYSDYWQLENYHPFYASEDGGACESPLAGLHFTAELFERLKKRGVEIHFVTLHVVGSWLPFLEADTRDHTASREVYYVPPSTASAITQARDQGRRVVAVGSTSVRALESASNDDGTIKEGPGISELFIQPGHRFSVVDGYFTNFHPARSSLMVLDAAYCPVPLLLAAYAEARRSKYLFFEFGDAVLYL